MCSVPQPWGPYNMESYNNYDLSVKVNLMYIAGSKWNKSDITSFMNDLIL